MWATRRDLAAIQDKKDWPRDPDGAPLIPACIAIGRQPRKKLMWEGTLILGGSIWKKHWRMSGP